MFALEGVEWVFEKGGGTPQELWWQCYRVSRHIVGVFIWPKGELSLGQPGTHKGFWKMHNVGAILF